MKNISKYAVVLSVLAAATLPLSAQVAGQVSALTLNGSLVNIPVVVTPGLGDIARAGNGVILVDPSITTMPWEGQQFILAHEAGHVVGLTSEAMADAYAGKILHIAGFTPAQMQVVYASMGRFLCPWGDTTHPPSPERIAIVKSAYESA